MQIHGHKYSVYTNIANDNMAVNPIKCYIFEKPLMQGCYKLYFELSKMLIHNRQSWKVGVKSLGE